MKTVGVFMNPHAGNEHLRLQRRLLDKVNGLLSLSYNVIGGDFKYFGTKTNDRADFCTTLRDLSQVVNWLFIIGGDGTFGDAMNNNMKIDPVTKKISYLPIGWLPNGHGNALRHSLPYPQTTGHIITQIRDGSENTIDAIEYVHPADPGQNQKALFAGIGLAALVTKLRAEMTRESGLGAYAWCTLKNWAKYPTTDAKVSLDGINFTLEDVSWWAIGKTAHFGYGPKVTPWADLRSGKIHSIAFTSGRSALVYAFMQSILGGNRFGYIPECEHLVIETDKVQELHLNGTPAGSGTRFEFRILPKYLTLRY